MCPGLDFEFVKKQLQDLELDLDWSEGQQHQEFLEKVEKYLDSGDSRIKLLARKIIRQHE